MVVPRLALFIAVSQLLLITAYAADPVSRKLLQADGKAIRQSTLDCTPRNVPLTALLQLAKDFNGEILTCNNVTQYCTPLNSSSPIASSAPDINMMLNLTYCKSAWNAYRSVIRPRGSLSTNIQHTRVLSHGVILFF